MALSAAQAYNGAQLYDQVGLNNTINSTNQALNTETTDAATTYAQNLQAYGVQKQQQGDNAAFQASTHGLYGSGIAANMQNKVLSDYLSNVQNLDQLRANKLADIAGRRYLAQDAYTQSTQALGTKYDALRSQWDDSEAKYQQTLAGQNAMYKAQVNAALGR